MENITNYINESKSSGQYEKYTESKASNIGYSSDCQQFVDQHFKSRVYLKVAENTEKGQNLAKSFEICNNTHERNLITGLLPIGKKYMEIMLNSGTKASHKEPYYVSILDIISKSKESGNYVDLSDLTGYIYKSYTTPKGSKFMVCYENNRYESDFSGNISSIFLPLDFKK